MSKIFRSATDTVLLVWQTFKLPAPQEHWQGCSSRQKKIRRSSEHRERLVEQDFVQIKAFANSPQPRRRKPAFVTRDNEASLYANSPTQSTPPPPLLFVISPSSPQPLPLHAPHAFRRLNDEEPTNHRSRRAATAAKPGSHLAHTPAEYSRDAVATSFQVEG